MSEEPPYYGPMTEQRARQILGEAVKPNDELYGSEEYLAWPSKYAEAATLDGHFTADELEAIAWWMRNKAGERTRRLERAFTESPATPVINAALLKLGRDQT